MSGNGVFIAFAAGTGVLPFLDLVAFILRRNLGMVSNKDSSFVDNLKFKFILNASFKNEDETIGLELCKGCERICKILGSETFEYNLIIGKEDIDKRWGMNTIEEYLKKYD